VTKRNSFDAENSQRFNRDFFRRESSIVAAELLGSVLVHRVDNEWLGGWIVETEAYLSENDGASHSSRGQKPGNASMFAGPGTLYVYPIHAKYCLNFVTEDTGVGSAVLIRAIEPVWGVEMMMDHRGTVDRRRITSGPGMICQAMRVDRGCDGVDFIDSDEWLIAAGHDVSHDVRTSPRIGISQSVDLPLRYFINANRYVSGPAGLHSRPRREELSGNSS
jgi:DNA-3-methyladenine glycosylase